VFSLSHRGVQKSAQFDVEKLVEKYQRKQKNRYEAFFFFISDYEASRISTQNFGQKKLKNDQV
jgi:uncharacterized protein YtpQ (UPF0354 family)